MGFSAETRILTRSGYKSISDLQVGDSLPTPVGVTKVTLVGYMLDQESHGEVVMSSSVTVIRNQLFYGHPVDSVAPHFDQVCNLAAIQTLFNAGLWNPPDNSCNIKDVVSLSHNEVFRLLGEASPFEYPDYDFMVKPSWVIGTENGMFVAGEFIAGTCLVPTSTYLRTDKFITPDMFTVRYFNKVKEVIGPGDITLFNRCYSQFFQELK